jgi:hypothetical protein
MKTLRMEKRTRKHSRREKLHGKSTTPTYLPTYLTMDSEDNRGCVHTNLTPSHTIYLVANGVGIIKKY